MKPFKINVKKTIETPDFPPLRMKSGKSRKEITEQDFIKRQTSEKNVFKAEEEPTGE